MLSSESKGKNYRRHSWKKTEEGGMSIPSTNILGDCQGTDWSTDADLQFGGLFDD